MAQRKKQKQTHSPMDNVVRKTRQTDAPLTSIVVKKKSPQTDAPMPSVVVKGKPSFPPQSDTSVPAVVFKKKFAPIPSAETSETQSPSPNTTPQVVKPIPSPAPAQTNQPIPSRPKEQIAPTPILSERSPEPTQTNQAKLEPANSPAKQTVPNPIVQLALDLASPEDAKEVQTAKKKKKKKKKSKKEKALQIESEATPNEAKQQPVEKDNSTTISKAEAPKKPKTARSLESKQIQPTNKQDIERVLEEPKETPKERPREEGPKKQFLIPQKEEFGRWFHAPCATYFPIKKYRINALKPQQKIVQLKDLVRAIGRGHGHWFEADPSDKHKGRLLIGETVFDVFDPHPRRGQPSFPFQKGEPVVFNFYPTVCYKVTPHQPIQRLSIPFIAKAGEEIPPLCSEQEHPLAFEAVGRCAFVGQQEKFVLLRLLSTFRDRTFHVPLLGVFHEFAPRHLWLYIRGHLDPVRKLYVMDSYYRLPSVFEATLRNSLDPDAIEQPDPTEHPDAANKTTTETKSAAESEATQTAKADVSEDPSKS